MRVWASLLGMVAAGVAALAASSAAAGSFRVEYHFTGCADGAGPVATLIDVGGVLYGTASYGGRPNCHSPYTSGGSIFSYDPNTGALTPLHHFKGKPDGADPEGRLVSVGGLLYGTTQGGGSAGRGTVFSLDPTAGVETVLYAFKGAPDGGSPSRGLVYFGGKLYGATLAGGASANCAGGCGSLFSLDPSTGTVTTIYSFSGAPDGLQPNGDMLAVGAKLYGTAYQGGANNYGTIFSFDPVSGSLKPLHVFGSSGDGANPVGGMVSQGGTLYGTTVGGGGGSGCQDGCGAVFSFDLSTGVETVLHGFSANGTDGSEPSGDLIYSDGLLYGTTPLGGGGPCHQHEGCGTVFSVDPTSGAETVLHAFAGGQREEGPDGGVVLVGSRLFGTAGGPSTSPCHENCGAIYSLSP